MEPGFYLIPDPYIFAVNELRRPGSIRRVVKTYV